MNKCAPTDFLFASSYIKSLENKLISGNTVDKLIEAASTDEVVKILSQYGYPEDGLSFRDAHFYDRMITSARAELYRLLAEIAPDMSTFVFFSYPNDYLNIKSILKATAIGVEVILTKSGSIPTQLIAQAISAYDNAVLTENMITGIKAANDIYARTKDPQMIDIVLDRYCYADMLKAAENSGSDYLRSYVKTLIDVTNIKSFFRLKKMDKDTEFAKKVFSEGGFEPEEKFIDGYNSKISDFADSFGGRYAKLVTGAAATLKSEEAGKMAELELMCDNFIMSEAAKAKYLPFGAEVVAGFIIAKETEFKNIRIIMAGRAAKLSHDKIKERLRQSYV